MDVSSLRPWGLGLAVLGASALGDMPASGHDDRAPGGIAVRGEADAPSVEALALALTFEEQVVLLVRVGRPHLGVLRRGNGGLRVPVACGARWCVPVDAGFRAVISTSIADIFRNNALKNGLLPVVVDPAVHRGLLARPGASVTVDLEAHAVTLSDGTRAEFEVEPFARYCLLNGVDELAFLLEQADAIARFEAR